MLIQHMQLNAAVISSTEHFYRDIHESEANSSAPDSTHDVECFSALNEKTVPQHASID
jgi:hypothetical protein